MKHVPLRYITLLFLIFPFLAKNSTIYADRVLLKNGKTIENVKSNIEKTSVRLKYENGKTENLSKSEIKSLKVIAVQWKQAVPVIGTTGPTAEELAKEAEEEKARVAVATERGDEFTPRAEEDMISPWGNFGRGLIPGYSGHYKTENTKTAITFSVLETIALFNFLDVISAKKTAHQIDAFDILSYSFGTRTVNTGSTTTSANTSSLSSLGLLVSNFQNAYGYESGLSGRTIAEQVGNNKAKAQLANQQTTAAGILGTLLLVDAISSYFSADSWNEGTYGGDKSDNNFVRPTKPSARLLRSVFVPGWGQVYGGDKVKGYSWMAGALGIFGYVVSTEQTVQTSYSKYKRDGYLSVVGLPLLTPTLGLTTATTSATENLTARVVLSEIYQGEAKAAFESAVQKRNQAWSLYGVFWAFNLIDAYFFSGKSFNQVGTVRIIPDYSLQPVTIVGNQLQNEHKLNLTLTYTY